MILSRPIVPGRQVCFAHLRPISAPHENLAAQDWASRPTEAGVEAPETKSLPAAATAPLRSRGHSSLALPTRSTQGESRASPVVPAESIFDEDLLYRSRVQTTFQAREPSFSSAAAPRRSATQQVLPGMAIAIAFLSVGYVFSEPLRGKGPAIHVVSQICGRVLERTQAWLRPRMSERRWHPLWLQQYRWLRTMTLRTRVPAMHRRIRVIQLRSVSSRECRR